MTMELAHAVIQLHPTDPVALARRELAPGTTLDGAGRQVVVRDPVPHGHKLALQDIAAGDSSPPKAPMLEPSGNTWRISRS